MRQLIQGLSVALVSLVLLLPGEAFADRRGGHGRGDDGHRRFHHGSGHHGDRSHRHHFRDPRHSGRPGFWHPHFRHGFGPRWHWNGRGWVGGHGPGW